MTKFILLLIAVAITAQQSSKAQSVDSLNQLKNHSFPVYYSSGHQQRAEAIAMQIEGALSFQEKLLDFKPTIEIIVLSTDDWKRYTAEPVVYGMPHYNEKNNRLIVAAEDNPFWKSFLPPPDQLPEGLRQAIQGAYSNADGKLTMQPFFDLLAIHELGHAFHMQGGLKMQRNWMSELFANILLHTYIAEKEPELLPALTVFPKMVIAGGTKEYKYTSLQDIQQRYGEIARQHPKNYGWYQCRWHAAAADIYTAAGRQVCRNLWNALKNNKDIMTDIQFINFLESKADKSIANMVKYWDRDTIN